VKAENKVIVGRMRKSDAAVKIVTEWMSQWVHCFIGVMKVVTPEEAEAGYTDICDFVSYEHGKWILNEVKGRSNDFTSVESFYWDDAIVCSKDAFDRKEANGFIPTRFIELSKDKTHVAVLDVVSTRDKWRVKPIHDPRLGYATNCYIVDKKVLTITELTEKGK
jgi:hypothetical protein